jgi:hypothetical protein
MGLHRKFFQGKQSFPKFSSRGKQSFPREATLPRPSGSQKEKIKAEYLQLALDDNSRPCFTGMGIRYVISDAILMGTSGLSTYDTLRQIMPFLRSNLYTKDGNIKNVN